MSNPYETPDTVNGHYSADKMQPCKGGCGKSLHISAPTCLECGAMQRSRGYKKKSSAALLAFFFGAFGIHRFYLGQWWGIFYLLTFWTFAPTLISLIESIVILATDQVNWDNKYNEGRPAGVGEGKGSGVLIIVVIFTFIIFIIGILAAIALPAYQDYTLRAKVSASLAELKPIREKVETYYQQNNAMPSHLAEVQLNDPTYVTNDEVVYIEGNYLMLQFNDSLNLNEHTIALFLHVDNNKLVWDCTGGTLPLKYRPRLCRK